ncbi:DUF397 domain-containing protein [Streptomyces xinghaiensis]|uniref:DUF397 domain-containing protein n=1 Tax=Streptomyces xinghaiensis TaxID=1038928 RepID=UPI0002E9A6D4|nr:DUF397 domain-containing protein [Streptomyces xinghaiensis]MZE79714.1 DUF397 domain-containing protein [Streptomyces sp. SID5475]
MSSIDERAWFKSSYSGSDGDDCVEVAKGTRAVHVRDSKDRRSPELAFSPAAWNAFITHTAQG